MAVMKGRHTEPWNTTESPETEPHGCGRPTTDRGAGPFMGKEACLAYGAEATGHLEEENEPQSKSHTFYKNSLQMGHRLKWKNLNGKTEYSGSRAGQRVLRLDTKSLTHTRKN